MEASSTTVNIEAPTFGQHNHGRNAGKFVEGCARCMELNPVRAIGNIEETPVEDGPIGVPVISDEDRPLTRTEVMEMLRQVAPQQGTSANLDQLVQLMLSDKAQKIAEETLTADRKERNKADMRRAVAEQMAIIKARQDACEVTGHSKENGRSAIVGQIHNDGFYHPLCQHCQKEFPKRRPQREEIITAVEN